MAHTEHDRNRETCKLLWAQDITKEYTKLHDAQINIKASAKHLKEEFDRSNEVSQRLSESFDEMSKLTIDINRMVSFSEVRQAEVLEKLRVTTDENKALLALYNDTQRSIVEQKIEFDKEIRATSDKAGVDLGKKLEEMKADYSKEMLVISEKVRKLDKFKWMIAGVLVVATFLISNFENIRLIFIG